MKALETQKEPSFLQAHIVSSNLSAVYFWKIWQWSEASKQAELSAPL